MEHEGSLPRLQESATCPYPEPDESNPSSPSHFLRAILILFFDLRLGFQVFSFPQVSSSKTYTQVESSNTCYMPRPSRYSRFDHRITFGEEYRPLSSLLCSFFQSSVTSPLLGPNILLSKLFCNKHSLRSSLNVNENVSRSYNTTGIIIVLYILNFIFLDSALKDKRLCTEW